MSHCTECSAPDNSNMVQCDDCNALAHFQCVGANSDWCCKYCELHVFEIGQAYHLGFLASNNLYMKIDSAGRVVARTLDQVTEIFLAATFGFNSSLDEALFQNLLQREFDLYNSSIGRPQRLILRNDVFDEIDITLTEVSDLVPFGTYLQLTDNDANAILNQTHWETMIILQCVRTNGLQELCLSIKTETETYVFGSDGRLLSEIIQANQNYVYGQYTLLGLLLFQNPGLVRYEVIRMLAYAARSLETSINVYRTDTLEDLYYNFLRSVRQFMEDVTTVI